MFILSHCCQSSFPRWESQSTPPPQDALQHCAGLWICCGGSSDSNLVLLLCVLVSDVHSCQRQYIFFCGSLPYPFMYSIDRVCLVDHVDLTCSLYNWWKGFGCSLATPLVLNNIFSEIFPLTTLPRKKNSPSFIIFLKTWGKNKVCKREKKYHHHIACMWGLSSCEELTAV